MSDTPRCDRHSLDMETEELDVELAKTYELAWQLERELNEAKAELVRKDEHDAVVAELLERLRERTESHLAASARDVATIQRQAVEISKWQSELTKAMPPDFKDWHQNSKDEWPTVARIVIENLRDREALAWEQAGQYFAEREHNANMAGKWQALTEALATALRDISDYDGPGFPHGTCSDIADQALDDYDAAKAGNMPDPLDEAVKRMESVSIDPWVEVPSKHAALDGLRNELILAAKGESA